MKQTLMVEGVMALLLASSMLQVGSSSVALPDTQMSNKSGSTFMAHKQEVAAESSAEHFVQVSYKQEVLGHNCGLGHAHGVYVSTTDDAAVCRSKCSANTACLGYTTYDSKNCGLKCLHYHHACDKSHQVATECPGKVVSYSKVDSSVKSAPMLTRPQPKSQNVTQKVTAVKPVAPSTGTNVTSETHSKAKNQTSAAPSQGKNFVSPPASKAKNVTSTRVTSTKAEQTPKASTKSVDTPKSVIKVNSKVASPTKVKAEATSQSIKKKTSAVKSSQTTGAAVSKKTQPVKVVAKTVQQAKAAKDKYVEGDVVLPTAETGASASFGHHRSWKEFLPKKDQAKGFAKAILHGAVAATSNSTKAKNSTSCACVHRHGKEVCHCLGEKDQISASVVKNHGEKNQSSVRVVKKK